MAYLITSVIILIVTVLLSYVIGIFKRSKKPPGPLPLPLLGNLLYIARQHPVNYIALQKVAQKYGDIVTLAIGPNKNVLISKASIARDIYSRNDCLNRPTNGSIWERNLCQNIGMAFSNGDNWSNIRKFTSRAMRDYGFGNRQAMEKLMTDELHHFVLYIQEKVKMSTDGVLFFNNFFQVSLLNLMTSMMTRRRHDYNDQELINLAKASREWFEAPLIGVLTVMAFPWTRYVAPGVLGYTKQKNALKKISNYARGILDHHRKKNTFLESPSCFTDSFLKAAHENKDDPSNPFTDDQFAILCTDLIQGGSDTTGNWLSFAIVLITIHPQVQEKLLQELVDVIGLDNSPDLSHKDKMPYTQAFILEVHRHARLTVVMPPRESTEDFYYQKYLIEKGTAVIVNLHACYMDKGVWGDPETFRPERFLNEDGTQLKNTDDMSIIFGAGRRMCFGESLGKDSSFLYLTTLLQNFKFEAPSINEYPTPSAEPEVGIILTPKPFYSRVSIRK